MNSLKRSYQRNISLSLWLQVFANFGIATLWILYLTQQGMSMVEIGLLESVRQLTSLIFEVPSGVLTDRFSYKPNLIISRVLAASSALLMIYATNFWGFAIAMIVAALSSNFESGTTSAFLFSSLTALKRQSEFLRYNSWMSGVLEVTVALGQMCAGFFAHRGLVKTYWISLAFTAVTLILIGFLKEPEDRVKEKEPHTSIISILKNVGVAFKQTPLLLRWMVQYSFFLSLLLLFDFYYQSQMNALSGWLISVIMLIGTLIDLLGVWIGARLGSRHTSLQLLPWIVLMTGASLLLVIFKIDWLNIFIYTFANGLMAGIDPVFDNDIQQRIPANVRATMGSISSMIYSVSALIVFPAMGWLIDQFGFIHSFIGLGGFMLIGGVVLVIRNKRMSRVIGV